MSVAKPQVLASLNRSHPLAVGLEAYWPFVEGSGGTVADYSGGQRDGTLVGMEPDERWTSEEDGSALSWDLLHGYVHTPVVPSLWTGFSVVAVCTSLATGNAEYTLASTSGPTGTQGNFYLRRYQYRLSMALMLGGVWTWRTVTSSVNMPAGYCVVAVTYDGAAMRLYQNGALVGSGNYTGTVNATTGYIELGRFFDLYWWYGNISMAAVWSRGLSEQEVKTLTADPYCLLRPAVQEPWLYYTAPATGGRVYRPTPFRLGPKLLPIGVLA